VGGRPLEQQARGGRRAGEEDVVGDLGDRLHAVGRQPFTRGGGVGHVEGDGVHAAAELLDEATDRRVLARRCADLDRVVADPDHAAPPADSGVLRHMVVHDDGTEAAL
jgi:hypothetical protein